MSAGERGKPFVGEIEWAVPPHEDGTGNRYRRLYLTDKPHRKCVVVVTPLLPDDPRPGETWLWHGREVVILRPKSLRYEGGVRKWWVADRGVPQAAHSNDLSRPPVLRTYRLTVTPDDGFAGHTVFSYSVEAESKDAALKLLSEALEEVPEP